jgi:hypothetical protein
MNRRQLLNAAAAIPLLPGAELWQLATACTETPGADALRLPKQEKVFSRVRPGDAGWPSEESWNKLRREVEGRLIKVNSPLSACREAPDSSACLPDAPVDLLEYKLAGKAPPMKSFPQTPVWVGDRLYLSNCFAGDPTNSEPDVYLHHYRDGIAAPVAEQAL